MDILGLFSLSQSSLKTILGMLQCKLIKAATAIHIQNNFQFFGKAFHFLADFLLLLKLLYIFYAD